MMKKWITSLAVLGLLSLVGAPDAQAQYGDKAEARAVTVTGQVIDLSCKVVHGLSGPDHKKCTEVCADRGVPLAILGSDGQIYLPVSQAMPGTGANERLKPFAEQKVKVTGKVVDRAGVKAIIIDEIART